MSTTCETYRDDLAAEACGALPAEESRNLASHVAECPACRGGLQRLRAALEPLDAYEAEPPPRLIEMTQRHVARRMRMRLPRPGRLSRPRVLRLAVAAAVMLCFLTVFVVPALQKGTGPSGLTTAQLHGLHQAVDAYAHANSGWMPSADNWTDALLPYLDVGGEGLASRGPEGLMQDFVFVPGLQNWVTGFDPGDVLFFSKERLSDDQFAVVTRRGRVELRNETQVARLLESLHAPR